MTSALMKNLIVTIYVPTKLNDFFSDIDKLKDINWRLLTEATKLFRELLQHCTQKLRRQTTEIQSLWNDIKHQFKLEREEKGTRCSILGSDGMTQSDCSMNAFWARKIKIEWERWRFSTLCRTDRQTDKVTHWAPVGAKNGSVISLLPHSR